MMQFDTVSIDTLQVQMPADPGPADQPNQMIDDDLFACADAVITVEAGLRIARAVLLQAIRDAQRRAKDCNSVNLRNAARVWLVRDGLEFAQMMGYEPDRLRAWVEKGFPYLWDRDGSDEPHVSAPTVKASPAGIHLVSARGKYSGKRSMQGQRVG